MIDKTKFISLRRRYEAAGHRFMWRFSFGYRAAHRIFPTVREASARMLFEAALASWKRPAATPTDLDEYRRILTKSGVTFDEITDDETWPMRLDIAVEPGLPIIDGPVGYATSLCFDRKGKLMKWVMWE